MFTLVCLRLYACICLIYAGMPAYAFTGPMFCRENWFHMCFKSEPFTWPCPGIPPCQRSSVVKWCMGMGVSMCVRCFIALCLNRTLPVLLTFPNHLTQFFLLSPALKASWQSESEGSLWAISVWFYVYDKLVGLCCWLGLLRTLIGCLSSERNS